MQQYFVLSLAADYKFQGGDGSGRLFQLLLEIGFEVGFVEKRIVLAELAVDIDKFAKARRTEFGSPSQQELLHLGKADLAVVHGLD